MISTIGDTKMVSGRESSKIFVAKIPPGVSKEELSDAFCKYGGIEETKMLFRDNGAFRGCAFIKYLNDDSAHCALELNAKTVFEKETLVVHMAEDKQTNQRKKLQAQEMQSALCREVPAIDNRPSYLGPQQLNGECLTNPYNFVDRKPDGCWNPAGTPWEMSDHPSNKALTRIPCYAPPPPEGHLYYHNAITGLTQWDKPSDLQPSAVVEMTPFRAGISGMDYRPSCDGLPGAREYYTSNSGLSSTMLDERNDSGRYVVASSGGCASSEESVYGPPGCNLFVFHLPDEWTDRDLHADFCQFGNIVSAKVMIESATQRSRGFGFVSYDCRESALLAIKNMQGFKAANKRLKVEFKKGESPTQLFDNDHAQSNGMMNGFMPTYPDRMIHPGPIMMGHN